MTVRLETSASYFVDRSNYLNLLIDAFLNIDILENLALLSLRYEIGCVKLYPNISLFLGMFK